MVQSIANKEKIRQDFNQIALTSTNNWDHNKHYHKLLQNHIPTNCLQALDVGCGTGDFSRVLAKHSQSVCAVDLSPTMIQVAKECSQTYSNIEYQVNDILALDLPDNYFDCIVSIATLHHLPTEKTLLKLKKALKDGGVLIILDLLQPTRWQDFCLDVIALPTHWVLQLLNNGYLRESEEIRKAWTEHQKTDTYATIADINELGQTILPYAKIRQHLFWRYSLIWRKK